ncbi:RND family transporter [Cyclobacterium xiamenense]|uniref:efflux RND transporter permease subunit n=1 Tax=Cyclobacterium xiamenense TaxID=1297121 RepID=UPI0035D0834F
MTRNIAFWRLLGALALTVFFAVIWEGLRFNYDFENFFQQDDPELAFYQEYRSSFENDNDYLLLALGNAPDIYDSLFLEKALALEKELAGLSKVASVVSLLQQEEPLIGPFGVRLRPVLDWSSQEALETSAQRLSEDSQWKGNLLSESEKYLLLFIKNQQMIGKEAGDSLYVAIESAVRSSGIPDYRMAGKIKAQGVFVDLLQQEFSLFMGLAGLWVLVLLWVLYRSWWAVLLPFTIISLGIFWAGSFLLSTGGELDVMLVMQPPILMVIGLSGLVHFLNHYQNSLRKGMPKEAAVASMCKELTLPVFLTALTTSLGFVSLYFTQIISLRWFGLYTGLGVLFLFLALITILPWALYTFPPLASSANLRWARRWERTLQWIFGRMQEHKTAISLGFIGTSLLAGVCMAQIKTNGYIVDSLPEGHPLKEDFTFFDRVFDGSKPLEVSLRVNDPSRNLFDYAVLLEIQKLEDFLRENYKTGNLLSPLTLVKGIHKAQNGGNPKAFSLPTEARYERMTPMLDRWIRENEWGLWTDSLEAGRISARSPDNGSFLGHRQHQRLAQFVAEELDKDLLQVRLTGTSYLIDKSHEQVTRKVFAGLGVAFFLVALIVGLLYRSWRMALIAMVPNVVPLICVGGVMYALGVDFKLSTSIVFAIAFGIAVDDSIHFMTNLRMLLEKGMGLEEGIRRTFLTTGKAIILTTLILSSGFLVLAFSELEIPWFTGVLVSLSLVVALLADLLWLPLLLRPLKKHLENHVDPINPDRQKLPK